MGVLIIQADARALPLADDSVDLIVTSPPYFALRSYTDGGQHYDGQIGAEATPQEYIENLITCTREWMRVLKPTGSIWVNLGDKYSGAPSGPAGATAQVSETQKQRNLLNGRRRLAHSIPSKSLMMLPERYRIACVDQLGLIARAVVIWCKPNGLPESITDRVRRSHEDWVHLTKEPRYFSAVDEIREPHIYPNRDRSKSPSGHMNGAPNPLGRLPGSVWEIATEPLKVPVELGIDHFAAFPIEWPRRIILGWSPSGICVECGDGRRPLSEFRITADRRGRQFNPTSGNIGVLGKDRVYTITGETCACPEPIAPTVPATILDPFGGTGTTALGAMALGRHGISVDRSADYCRIACWRTSDPGELAKAMRVEKPKAEVDGQGDLFEFMRKG